jgi:hypothetical protein
MKALLPSDTVGSRSGPGGLVSGVDIELWSSTIRCSKQRGYRYELAEPAGRNFHPDFSRKLSGGMLPKSGSTARLAIRLADPGNVRPYSSGPTIVAESERAGALRRISAAGLRLPQTKLSGNSNQVARGRIRRFESYMPSQAVGLHYPICENLTILIDK